ncbi:hypothetical protein P4525_00830 [Peribacillus psychrosaccharolyticus]|uniref:hypothetical protein n=1 Tax=Peribacillus psychrosaccharolyticus TaxID=1407 RepID=UPI00058D2B4D|nr:hypothetical protein [Peribacillus psychrosaccharolyticus]MED3742333.1 hypothetical protein [Peribacillus psychrosaccharolyticus]
MKTPAGKAGQVRPRRSVSIDAAYRPPAERETPGTEINSPILKLKKKTVDKLDFHPSLSTV